MVVIINLVFIFERILLRDRLCERFIFIGFIVFDFLIYIMKLFIMFMI